MILWGYGISLRFDVTPTAIQFGFTKNFSIICSVTKGSLPRLNWLNSIILTRLISSHQSYNDTYIPIASINSVNGHVKLNVTDALGSGVIDNNKDLFISVTWLYPSTDMTGEYICEANGMDATWRPVTVNEKVRVHASEFNISFLRDELTHLHKSVDELKASSQVLSGKFESSKRWFFTSSDVYKGRRYYLSQQDPISRSEQSMTICVLYGGYLAEIGDVDEFNFIKSFIKQFNGYRLVLIGGTKEVTNSVWKYRQSGTLVPTFLVKIRNYPNSNCLYLYDGVEWFAVDDNCYYTNPNYPTRFLCELPDNAT
ncbi:hypothetical protein Btru_076260 [Bulinus truncatus]|nr:hypothetical protein Btru_076260 [Bulinus truncatus]